MVSFMSKTSPIQPAASAEPEPQDERQRFSAAVARGIAQGKTGEVVAGDAVFKWLLSWGTDNELPPPAPGRP
jgi:predicted transcriptional regulator